MAATAKSDLPTLGLGVIGLGNAFLGMLPNFASHPLIKFVAAADTRKEAREKFTRELQGRAYETIEELCQDPQVDVVYIATPSQLHAEHAITAARRGKHIILEKPMALTLKDCEAINREIERAGVKLVVGYTNGYDPPILKMREVVRSGELGRVRLILTFNYTDWLYRPRRPDELDTQRGGGIVLRQAPHQIDMVRLLGGGLVRSVRASVGAWDGTRPTEGAMMAFLDFEDGAVAKVVYNGFGHFDAEEFWGREVVAESYGGARRALMGIGGPVQEETFKASRLYGGPSQRSWGAASAGTAAIEHERFGITIVSCDRGDMRPSPQGITVYGDEEVRIIPVPFGRGGGRRATLIDELYDAVVLEKPLIHDGRWGMATLEICLAILESARQRQEIFLSHQTAAPD